METLLKIIAVIVILPLILGLTFIVDALIVKGICWCFGFVFTWKLAFGVWLIILLLGGLFKSNVTIKN